MEWTTREATALYAGAGIALAAGLLMGAAMKPDLGWDDRPVGPQIVAGTDGARASGPFDDGSAVSFAAYNGRVPDYVIGSDAKRAAAQFMVASAPREAAEPHRARLDDEADPAFEATRADNEDGPSPRVSYPSIDGGAPSDAVLSAAPDQG